jgi:hypothetical protein
MGSRRKCEATSPPTEKPNLFIFDRSVVEGVFDLTYILKPLSAFVQKSLAITSADSSVGVITIPTTYTSENLCLSRSQNCRF